MSLLFSPDPDQYKSDWICLEFITGRKIFMKLNFDPFSDTIPSGNIKVDDAFLLMKAMGADGVARVGIMSLKEDPVEPLEPPYIFNLDHVCSMAKLSPESKLYDGLVKKTSGLEVQRSSLVIPG